MENQNVPNPKHVECVAFCPTCGADLARLDKQCICKKEGCGWSCSLCQEDDDI